MEIRRDRYLNLLISKKHNGLIKVITGMRRCGKSYLLFKLFKGHLLSEKIGEDHIIEIAFDAFVSRPQQAIPLSEKADQRPGDVLRAAG